MTLSSLKRGRLRLSRSSCRCRPVSFDVLVRPRTPRQPSQPIADVVQALRQLILKTDPEIGEEIRWNAPAFFFTGELEPSDPKLYQRYLVVFNLFRKDCIRLVFWRGASVKDAAAFLEGDYADGRRLAMFHDMADVTSQRTALRNVITQQVGILRKLSTTSGAGTKRA